MRLAFATGSFTNHSEKLLVSRRRITAKCPLCDAEVLEGSRHLPDRDAVRVVCRRCGGFVADGALVSIANVPVELRPLLSAYTRQCHENGVTPEMLTTANLEALASTVAIGSPAEKFERLLAILADRTAYPGAPVAFSPERDFPLIAGKNPAEAVYHRDALGGRGFVELRGGDQVVVTHAGWEHREATRKTAESRLRDVPMERATIVEWDVFICHASEDKELAVEPLANALRDGGLKVWYDRWELDIGDSLRRKIDEGLSLSRYGIVVLSRAFLRKKPWTELELDGLVQREIAGQKVILPVWHGIAHADVARYSPPLADKVAGSTDHGIEQLAERLIRAMKSVSGSPATSEPVTTDPSPTVDKWVDTEYPADAGLIKGLEAQGYQTRWCSDPQLSRALDVEGWELVYQELGGGQRAVLRLQDRPYNQTLIKKRRSSLG